MRLERNSSRTSLDNNWDCKIKRVNPAFRSVSTPRITNDLRGPGAVLRGSSRWIVRHISRARATPRSTPGLLRAHLQAGHYVSVRDDVCG
jgi:hypothetical protein